MPLADFWISSSLKDLSQPIPTQELVAKDLHGYEWHFKHIFRGIEPLIADLLCIDLDPRGSFLIGIDEHD